jgi:hypothetical protein
MPIIPITIQNHKVWVYVDSGATFSMISAAEAGDMGINLAKRQATDGRRWRRQLYSDLYSRRSFQLGTCQITAPIGFSERLGVGFNLLGRTGVFNEFEVCFNDHARKVTFQQLLPDVV